MKYIHAPNTHGCIRYGVGYDHEELLFAVFEIRDRTEAGGNEQGRLSIVIARRRNGLLNASLRGGSGKTWKTDAQLFELKGEDYESSNARVGLDEFEAYLDSSPAEYSIKSLLKFVE